LQFADARSKHLDFPVGEVSICLYHGRAKHVDAFLGHHEVLM